MIGGLTLPEAPMPATGIAEPILPERLFVPLAERPEQRPRLMAKEGQAVLCGQTLASDAQIDTHAPASGRIRRIGRAADLGLDPRLATLIVEIEVEAHQRPIDPITSASELAAPGLLRRLGIAGLGGAGFPTAGKFPTTAKPRLLINAVECEPGTGCDRALMDTEPERIAAGIQALTLSLGAQQVLLGGKSGALNTLESIRALIDTPDAPVRVKASGDDYPAGSERQLIAELFGLWLAPGERPAAHDILSVNIGTAHAIGVALSTGLPLTRRVTTITGPDCQQPHNRWTFIGTRIGDLLQACGESTEQPIVMGGPLTGTRIQAPSWVTGKRSNSLYLGPTHLDGHPEQACIRCRQCEPVCPERLEPQSLYFHARAGQATPPDLQLGACIECACCELVCPSHIPLVQYFRNAKALARETQQTEQRAERSRYRFDARAQRIERQQELREAKRRRKRAELEARTAQSTDKSDAIAAAVERTRERREKGGS